MVYEEPLQTAGLTRDQAALYEVLIKNGPLPASRAAHYANISRTLSYKVLDELLEKKLVEKKEVKGKVTTFIPVHPLRLKEVAENAYRKAQDAIIAVDTVFDRMISDYNMVSGKPGVRFYEGKEGVRAILEDSLTAQDIIYSYADLEAIEKYIPDINTQYVKDRERLNVRKWGITIDTPFNREFLRDYAPGTTEARFIRPPTNVPFDTIMQMYNTTTSYITLSDKYFIGIIIQNQHITAMHRHIFEHQWEHATPIAIGG